MDGQKDARQYFERKNASMNERKIQIRNEGINERRRQCDLLYWPISMFSLV